ncbi:MAG: S66 peptidase family protein [Halobacteriaceae archaeon]
MTEFVVPPALDCGDSVAVLAPSGGSAAAAPDVLSRGVRRLRELGLSPVVYPTARQRDDYLRATPRARAADLHAAFRDPDIAGAFATIGGDDELRVLEYLDAGVLRGNPTRFYGMSDNTNLALFLWRAGVVSYYGGQVMNQVAAPGPLHPYTERYLRRALFEPSPGELGAAGEWADLTASWDEYADAAPEYRPAERTWTGGDTVVEGRLWGGCLAVLEWQLMTGRYLPAPDRLDGAVLAIETAEDMPPAKRVRWALMCMGERGLLGRFDAVLVGRPATANWREQPDRDERERYRRAQREAIEGELDRYNPGAPVVFDLDFGHTLPAAPVPIGGRVVVDPGARRVAFPAPANA